MTAINSTQAPTDATSQADEALTPKWLCTWANGMGYRLYEFAYAAQAAKALLHEYAGTDANAGLTGVSYLLSRLSDDCERAAADANSVSDRAGGLKGAGFPTAHAEDPPHTSGKANSLIDLPGERGELADIASKAAIEIEQSAATLQRLVQDENQADVEHVIAGLLKRIKVLACLIMSCTSADEPAEDLRLELSHGN